MADYQPHSSLAMRRPQRPYSDEEATRTRTIRADLEPAPQPWPGLTYVALFLLCGFVALQMYPSTHWRHPQDRTKTWIPHDRTETDQASSTDPFYSSLSEEQGQQAQDLASQGTVSNLSNDEKHDEYTLAFLKKASEQVVHIFVSTDGADFRPLAVLVNSTISNAVHPERLHFHLVLPASHHSRAKHLAAFFQDTKIDIVSENIDFKDMEKHITFRKNSKARPELQSVYNFAPFLLPLHFKDVGRFIYLDADIVVKGNIEELIQIDLGNRAAAAVEDCSQTFETYFDFNELAKIQARPEKPTWVPTEPIKPDACVFNRGVLVIDTNQWIKQQVTEAILWWMDEFQSAESVLYKYGLSQPPFLLALYGKYMKLDTPWNVRGLGRNEFSEREREFLESKYGHKPERKPFISLDADTAKILHFNGKFKPWKQTRPVGPSSNVVSRCGSKGIECAKLWWEYLSPVADGILRHDDAL
ncbi:probable galacturonosyltransferase-like 10 isoform X2 [Physcomitrium patens]|uniref:Hexosyltransferase n=2 Tax=Physcomitrium patens TaxID=3218 RepID=A0A7I4ERJ9_PHYPA|nr:glycosyltransferase 8 domain-containing protein 2-like isoform X2 [Physcomitrium patens]|eukprot:XP_024384790.1 glycosyltransferase 8 domain-containing protein 2-like isoform X2 [Physcomitrella patens]